jgi:hypothetical protein
MKYNYKLILRNLVLVFTLTLMNTSCSDWIDHDLNVDPDSPANVPMSLLLPSVEQAMGYHLVGNNTVGTNNIWMQQFDGTDRQKYTEARYQLAPADVNNVWNSIYAEIFTNLHVIIEKGSEVGAESPHFVGVAQVLEATTLGIATDLFGDMPYTEAIKGSENLKPKYDTQEVIYSNIFSLLDNAVINLEKTINTLAVKGDPIYKGDLAKWKKAAYSIKARHALQLSKINGTKAYTDALAAVAKGFASNSDDFLVPWEAANKNPINQFMTQRTDIRIGSTLVNMLKATNDPRLEFYAEKDASGNYTGSDPGSQNGNASKLGTYNASETSKSILMTYSELKFIEAEAQLGLGETALAQAAYEAAVAASVLRVTGAVNTTWLDANINGVPVTLENIMKQKYIAGYSTNQPYADYRRTGYPVLSLAKDAVLSSIPTRFPYAQDELDYNTANVPSATISDKVWWNK